MSKDYVAQLSAMDACAVSDAADQLGLPAAVTGVERRAGRGRICGRVVTVTLSAGALGAGPKRHLCTAAIERAQAGDVVVVEQRTGVDAAGWGGILSNAARARGLSGAIVEGPARDIDEADEIGFPVFSRSNTCRTARGRIFESATGAPVKVGEVNVSEGDYVVADASGVVFVPENRIAEVIAAAERIARREAAMTEAVNRGERVSAVMGADYEDMLSKTPRQSGTRS